MKRALLLIVCFAFSVFVFKGYSQCFEGDTMRLEKFDAMVSENLSLMNEEAVFSEMELYCLLKLYNTLHIAGRYKEKQDYIDFISLFNDCYWKKVFEGLDCSYSDGLSVYSKKHDIFICPCMSLRQKDYFSIVEQ